MTNPQTEPNRSYFLIIPAFITDDIEIDDSTAMLFGHIMCLSNAKGYCWASDDYLSKLTRVSDREIQNRLRKLEDRGYIKRKTFKNGFTWQRYIYPNIQNNFTKGTGVHLDSEQVCASKANGCSEEQNKHNNISKDNNREEVVVVLSESEKDILEKTALLVNWDFNASVRKLAFEYTVDEIRTALAVCKAATDMVEVNAYFTSALKGKWQPKASKEEIDHVLKANREKEEQQQKQQAQERLEQDMISFAKEWQGKLRTGYDIIPSERGIRVILKIKENLIPFDKDGLTYIKIFVESYKG